MKWVLAPFPAEWTASMDQPIGIAGAVNHFPSAPSAMQVVEWVLAPVRAEWTSQAWQAHLASPEAFIQQYTPVTPDGAGGWQVGWQVGWKWVNICVASGPGPMVPAAGKQVRFANVLHAGRTREAPAGGGWDWVSDWFRVHGSPCSTVQSSVPQMPANGRGFDSSMCCMCGS